MARLILGKQRPSIARSMRRVVNRVPEDYRVWTRGQEEHNIRGTTEAIYANDDHSGYSADPILAVTALLHEADPAHDA